MNKIDQAFAQQLLLVLEGSSHVFHEFRRELI